MHHRAYRSFDFDMRRRDSTGVLNTKTSQCSEGRVGRSGFMSTHNRRNPTMSISTSYRPRLYVTQQDQPFDSFDALIRAYDRSDEAIQHTMGCHQQIFIQSSTQIDFNSKSLAIERMNSTIGHSLNFADYCGPIELFLNASRQRQFVRRFARCFRSLIERFKYSFAMIPLSQSIGFATKSSMTRICSASSSKMPRN